MSKSIERKHGDITEVIGSGWRILYENNVPIIKYNDGAEEYPPLDDMEITTKDDSDI